MGEFVHPEYYGYNFKNYRIWTEITIHLIEIYSDFDPMSKFDYFGLCNTFSSFALYNLEAGKVMQGKLIRSSNSRQQIN